MTAWRNNNSPRRTKLWAGCILLALLVMSTFQLFAQTESNYSTRTAAGTNITNNASVNYTVGGVAQTPISSNNVTTVVQQIDSFYLELNNVVAVPTADVTRTNYSGVPNETIDIRYTIHNLSNGTIVVAPSLAFGALIGSAGTNNASGSNTALYTDDGSGNATTTALASQVTVSGSTFVFHVKVTIPSASTATTNWGQYTVALTDKPDQITPPASAAGNWTIPTAFTGGGSYSGADLKHTAQINVTTNAAMVLDKWFSTTQGNPSTKITHGAGGASNKFWVNLTYTNNGSKPSGLVTFHDALPAGMTYVQGSAYFNATPVPNGGTNNNDVLAATNGGSAGTGTFTWNHTTNTVDATVTGVPQSGGVVYYFTFQVSVPDSPATFTNTAPTTWSDGGTVPTTTNGTVVANYTVDPRYQITLKDYTPGTATLASTATQLAGNVASPTLFLLNVVNGGNAPDMVYVGNNLGGFPAGTTFSLYTNAGTQTAPAIGTSLTLISGTSGQPNASYQLGQLAVGASMDYVLAVQLPTGTAVAAAVNYTTTATATGQAGAGTGADQSTATQTIQDVVNPIDLTTGETTGGFYSNSAGHNTNALSVTGTTPASYPALGSYTYALYLYNSEWQAENLKLVASNSTTFSTTDTLPAGWSVSYFYPTAPGDCTSASATPYTGSFNVTAATVNAGALLAGITQVCAKVTIPFGTPVASGPGYDPVYFQAVSTLNPPANDYVHDALNVTAFHYLTIDTQTKTVNAGASVLYTAVLTNYGNVDETAAAPSFFSSITNATSSSATPAGPAIFTINSSVNPGAAAPYIVAGAAAANNELLVAKAIPNTATPTNFYIQVMADNTDKPGDKVVTTVVFNYNSGTTVTGTYTTTVLSAATNVTIQKTQALDPSCNGKNSGGSALSLSDFSLSVVQAKPGQCVAYRITAGNGTGAVIDNLYLTDTLQTGYVDYCDGTASPCGTSVPAAAWVVLGGATQGAGGGYTSPLVKSNTLTNLPSGQSVAWQFEVQVK